MSAPLKRPVAGESGWWLAGVGPPPSLPSKFIMRNEGERGENLSHGRTLWLVGDSPAGLPAQAQDASATLVFDGFLYNAEKLQANMQKSLGPFANQAEFLLQAYRYWGEDFFKKLRGVYALILWDAHQDLLLAVRDHLGIYPLFYAQGQEGPLLSTSVEALLEHPRVSRELNRAALADHLCVRWPDLEETYYVAIKRLPPGHVLRLQRGHRKVYRYWDPAPHGIPVKWAGPEEIARFDTLMAQAVDHCLSLGPAGIFLSGGLDSVSVAAYAADICTRRGIPAPWAFSLAFPGPEDNEEAIQKKVAATLGLPQVLTPLEETWGTQGLFMASLEMSRTLPFPLINIWLPAYYHLALQAKVRGCSVILTGVGGDEWLTVDPALAADLLRGLDLAGLWRFWQTLHHSFQLPRPAQFRSLFWRFGLRPLLASAARRFLTQVAPQVITKRRGQHFHRHTPDWVAPDPGLRRELFLRNVKISLEDQTPKSYYTANIYSIINAPYLSLEMEEFFVSNQLAGVRHLHPFFDVDLVDLLYRIPPGVLDQGGRNKGLVRRALAQRFHHLGFESQRKRVSLNYVNAILLAEGQAAWRARGGTPALAELGIIEPRKIQSAVEHILQRKGGSTNFRALHQVWYALNLDAWVRDRI